MSDYITLYDSTLRDGAQTRGIDFTVADKIAITRELDALGIDYIEGGWPGANPTDDAYFAHAPQTRQARITAFGMTRRSGRSAENDPGLQDLLAAGTKQLCIVGKSWDRQVKKALGITLDENLRLIEDSIRYLSAEAREVFFDAEHFFDGSCANEAYACRVIDTALSAGARWVILCDTNGGSLADQIGDITRRMAERFGGERLGIHCHNDTECAVANSLAAVQAGARQVQGTLNGLGERCGNANLVSIIPNLLLKMGYRCGVSESQLSQLTHIARAVDERLNRESNPHAAYVGASAFAHKGGLHVSAMAKDSASYEHIDPALVGNERLIVVSDKAGKSNIISRLKQLGLEAHAEDKRINALVKDIKAREQQGYAYEYADASFELYVRRHFGSVPAPFTLHSFRVTDERRYNAKGQLVTISEATIKLSPAGSQEIIMTVAEGNGPVNALDAAIRKALLPSLPALASMQLVDYKVRILTPQEATAALTRVMIESEDTASGRRWTTIGVSHNVIDASWNALQDAITYIYFVTCQELHR